MPLPVNDAAPVERRLLRNVAYDRLYDAILDGTLAPGEMLLDDALIAWLGVSRTPIREALARLADIGLVEMPPNRYTRVAPIDPRTIQQALYTTGLLHEHAARIAVPQLDDAAVARLEDAAVAVRTAAAGAACGRAAGDFLLELERTTGNEVLHSMGAGLRPHLLRYLTTGQHPVDTGDLPERVVAIAGAAQARDGQTAGDLVAALYASTLTQFESE
jgi:DNA-binding GntR family transcriptional regulator